MSRVKRHTSLSWDQWEPAPGLQAFALMQSLEKAIEWAVEDGAMPHTLRVKVTPAKDSTANKALLNIDLSWKETE